MDSEMPYFLIWSLCMKHLVHHAVYCISLSYLLCNPYIPFLINYEIFYLLVVVCYEMHTYTMRMYAVYIIRSSEFNT